MPINFASICPHPPLVIPNIGKDRIETVSDTIESLEALAEDFEQQDPDTTVVISPHAPQSRNAFVINEAEFLKGHFHEFGDFSTELAFKNDLDLVKSIAEWAEDLKLPLTKRKIKELDHGTLVPLYYLTQGKPDLRIVSIAYSDLSLEQHFEFGKALRKASQDKNVALVASGDMSHRLNKRARKFSRREGLSSPGYSPRGKEFDEKLIELIKEKNVEGILNMDEDLVQEAGQCGYRSVIVLLGALEELEWEPEVLSYEGPFGVGYLVASLI